MKNDLEAWRGTRVPELRSYDFIESTVTVNVKVVHPSLQVHREY